MQTLLEPSASLGCSGERRNFPVGSGVKKREQPVEKVPITVCVDRYLSVQGSWRACNRPPGPENQPSEVGTAADFGSDSCTKLRLSLGSAFFNRLGELFYLHAPGAPRPS